MFHCDACLILVDDDEECGCDDPELLMDWQPLSLPEKLVTKPAAPRKRTLVPGKLRRPRPFLKVIEGKADG